MVFDKVGHTFNLKYHNKVIQHEAGCFLIVYLLDILPGKEYSEFLHKFMSTVKQNYGEKVARFEDYANHNAFELLARYNTTHLVPNGDIQGTTYVVLSGLVAALKLFGGTLANHKFLFLGVGEAENGIAKLMALEMSKQIRCPCSHAVYPIMDSTPVQPQFTTSTGIEVYPMHPSWLWSFGFSLDTKAPWP